MNRVFRDVSSPQSHRRGEPTRAGASEHQRTEARGRDVETGKIVKPAVVGTMLNMNNVY